MSYKQIFRRANRILKSTLIDAWDQFTKDQKDLDEFDDMLKNASKQQSSQRESPGANRPGSGQSSQRQSGGQGQRQEGRRKPGERDDAFYFAVLGLSPTADVAEIKRAYKRLMRKYHPDVVTRLSPAEQSAASERAKAINEAYQIIERRRGYK
jgi:DnaJ-domain-containing protein 1